MAVPQILDAPGTAYCTSNKRDLYDTTARARANKGELWLFDPQGVADTGMPPFWWKPLASCQSIASARRPAGVPASASRPACPGNGDDGVFSCGAGPAPSQYVLGVGAATKARAVQTQQGACDDVDGGGVPPTKPLS